MRLGPFLRQLTARLEALEQGELRRLVLVYAERLTSGERDAFLACFSPVGDTAEVEARRSTGSDLLRDVDQFVERLSSGEYVEGWGWDPDIYDERAFGDESWAWEMDDLLIEAGNVFLVGDMKTAREAYGPLLKGLGLDQMDVVFPGAGLPSEMLETDLSEATARYLRAVYETTPLTERASALADAWVDVWWLTDREFRSVEEARPEPLPELAEFLPRWVDHLRSTQLGEMSGTVKDLLVEAVERHQGAEGLAALARERGSDSPELFLDWVTAVERAGSSSEAAEAAEEALARLGGEGRVSAQIADLLATVISEPLHTTDARRRAFRAEPTRGRLLDLIQAAGDDVDRILEEEAQHSGLIADRRLAAVLLLLTGRIDEALVEAEAGESLGWSRRGHVGSVVVPYLLAAGAGGLPVQPNSLMAGLLGSVDDPGFFGWTDDLREDSEPALGNLLAQRLVTPTSSEEQARWRRSARRLVEDRVEAVAAAKHRGAYARAARLGVACAEAFELAEGAGVGQSFLALLHERYARFSALRRELDRAQESSPLLPRPTRR